MFCRKCGNPLLDDSVFCQSCGCKVSVLKTQEEPLSKMVETVDAVQATPETTMVDAVQAVPETTMVEAVQALESVKIVETVEAKDTVETVAPEPKKTSKAQGIFYNVSRICSTIGLSLNALVFGAVLFVIVVLIAAGINTDSSGFFNSSLMLNVAEVIVSLATAIIEISFIVSTVGFVFSIIQKVEPKQKRTSTTVFVASFILMGVTYVCSVIGSILYARNFFDNLFALFELFNFEY